MICNLLYYNGSNMSLLHYFLALASKFQKLLVHLANNFLNKIMCYNYIQ